MSSDIKDYDDFIKDYDDFKIEKTQKLSIPENIIEYTLTLPLITIINYKDTLPSIKNKVFRYSRKKEKITTSYNKATIFTEKNKYKDIMLYDIKNQKFYNILSPDVENIITILQNIEYKNTEDSNITSPAEFYLKHKGGEKYIILKIYIGLIFIIHNEVLIILDNIGQQSEFTCVIYNYFKEIILENIKIPKDEFDELFDIVKNNAIINETLTNYF